MQNPLPANAKMVFKGMIFEVWQWQQKMFDGSFETFERLRRPDTAGAIAVVGDKILIQTQEQPDSARPFVSFPGGRVDEGEDSLAAAKRELLEESGYVSDDWTLWMKVRPVSKIEWNVYTYIARNCVYKQEPHLDPGEKISNRLISFDEFLALCDEPSFRDFELNTELLRVRMNVDRKTKLRTLLLGESS